jgi:bacterioferritin
MKGDPKIIALLNEALKEELTAINQYFLHAEMNEDWGYERLAKVFKRSSIEEMKHAEHLIERILFLEGSPTVGEPLSVNIGKNVPEQFKNDLAAEHAAVASYNAGIRLAQQIGDDGTKQLLQKHLKDEESHVDWLEAQLHAIEEVGLPGYLTQQLNA